MVLDTPIPDSASDVNYGNPHLVTNSVIKTRLCLIILYPYKPERYCTGRNKNRHEYEVLWSKAPQASGRTLQYRATSGNTVDVAIYKPTDASTPVRGQNRTADSTSSRYIQTIYWNLFTIPNTNRLSQPTLVPD